MSGNHRNVYIGDSEHHDAPLPMTIRTMKVIIICNSAGKGCKMLASVGKRWHHVIIVVRK